MLREGGWVASGGRGGFVNLARLCKTKTDGPCAHLGGVWLAGGGAGARHPWTPTAGSRVLGCGAVFLSLQVVGQEVSFGGQKRFLSEPSRIK